MVNLIAQVLAELIQQTGRNEGSRRSFDTWFALKFLSVSTCCDAHGRPKDPAEGFFLTCPPEKPTATTPN